MKDESDQPKQATEAVGNALIWAIIVGLIMATVVAIILQLRHKTVSPAAGISISLLAGVGIGTFLFFWLICRGAHSQIKRRQESELKKQLGGDKDNLSPFSKD